MTATIDPTADVTSAFRPAWLTDQRVAGLLRWVNLDDSGPSGAGALTAIAPYDAAPTVPVPAGTAADVAAAVARSRTAQAAWGAVPLPARAAVMLRFHDLLLERQDEVMDLIQWEMGKARCASTSSG